VIDEPPSLRTDGCYKLDRSGGTVVPLKELRNELRKYNMSRGWVPPPTPAPATPPKPKKAPKKREPEAASETPTDQVACAVKRPRVVPEQKCCDYCAVKWAESRESKRNKYGKHCLFCYRVGDRVEALRSGVGWERATIQKLDFDSFQVEVEFLYTTGGLSDCYPVPTHVRRMKQDAKERAQEPVEEKAQEKEKEGDKEEVRPTAASDAPTVCTGDVSIPGTDTPRAKRPRPDTLPAPLKGRGDVSPAAPPPLPAPAGAHNADLQKRNEELEQQLRELKEEHRKQEKESARRLAETAKERSQWEERAKVLQDRVKDSEREARRKEGDWTQPRPGKLEPLSMAVGDSVYVKDDGHVFIARIEELQPKKIRVRRYMHYWAARLTEETVMNEVHPPGTRQKDLILKAEEEWVERDNVVSVRCLVVEPHMMPHVWYSDKQMHPDRMKYKKGSRSAPGFSHPLIAGALQ